MPEQDDQIAAPLAEAGRHFLLRPDVTFFNHGSFGACPAPVFEGYQRWQRELESEPVEFLGRRIRSLLEEARVPLSKRDGATAEALKACQWDEYQIEIPVHDHGDYRLMRLSIQAYNSPADVDRLVSALAAIL